jgi:light-regulated signal transduction histidine kinase (bacteriophytochrome)
METKPPNRDANLCSAIDAPAPAMNQPLSITALTECDREPIHIPGAVQPHGGLLAVDADSWRVTHASANLAAFIGVDAALALGQPLPTLLGADARNRSVMAATPRRHPGRKPSGCCRLSVAIALLAST